MAMRKAVVAGAGLAALLASAAVAAPAGAPQDAAMQAGGWGPRGWQAGASAPVGASAPAGAVAAPASDYAAQPAMTPPPYRPMPPMGDYKPVRPGQKLKGAWLDPDLTVQDWQGWGLSAPGPSMRWIRYYDDAVLIDGDGRVVTAREGIDWDVPHHRGPDGYEAGDPGPMPGGPVPPMWQHPPIQSGTTTYRAGPNTTVTTQVIAPPPIVYQGGYAPGYGYGGGYGGGYGYAGGGTIVSVTPSVVTTTTTTTTETVWRKSHRVRAWGCRCAPTRRGKLIRR